jgi:intracellular septation protein A
MVRTAGTPVAQPSLDDLPSPTWRLLIARGAPQFAAEAMLPVGAFYAAWRMSGLAAGVAVSTVVSLAIAAILIRAGRDVGLVAATAVFVLVQAAVGLASGSTTVYLAQPVVLSALWGLVYLGSVVIGRPLIGVLASAWYPFPAWFRCSAPFRREFAMQSLVWSVYCFARAAVRLVLLLHSGVGVFLVVSFATGAPVIVLLVAWGLWHARRTFARLDASAVTA